MQASNGAGHVPSPVPFVLVILFLLPSVLCAVPWMLLRRRPELRAKLVSRVAPIWRSSAVGRWVAVHAPRGAGTLLGEASKRPRTDDRTQIELGTISPTTTHSQDEQIRDQIQRALEALGVATPSSGANEASERFSTTIEELVVGRPEYAALGLDHFMRVPDTMRIPALADGVNAIVHEVKSRGDQTMRECLNYVLRQRAGSSPTLFPNSPYPRDCGAHGLRVDRMDASGKGMRFEDFVSHPSAQRANLHAAHVLALRLYTTAAFVAINRPLRRLSPEGNRCAEPHPFPNCVRYLSAAIKQLRANNVPELGTTRAESYLFRGFQNVRPTDDFMQRGGSEPATMSTTTSLPVALKYALSERPILLRLRMRNFMELGAEIAFLSAFPEENEVVFPPQTFILPERAFEVAGISVIDASVTVT